jgi:glucosyl-3-phosphoglycerate phosphatase
VTGERRWFVCRHGETVYNAARRMQGDALHTPLTRAGFAQAEAMGQALRERLGPRPPLGLWVSPAGRAHQTLAIICEHLGLDWHDARIDPRLAEIDVGDWSGRLYGDVAAESGPILDASTGLFIARPPGGEWYDEIASRLADWIEETSGEEGDRLVVMHGISSRVLRALLTGAEPRPECGAPVAPGLPQGSVVEISEGVERVLGRGTGEVHY